MWPASSTELHTPAHRPHHPSHRLVRPIIVCLLRFVKYPTSPLAPQSLEAVPHANASFTYIDGDGTVPTESATAHGLEAAASVAIKADHRGLVGSQVRRAGVFGCEHAGHACGW